MGLRPFADRGEAGRALAGKLLGYAGHGDVVVLGLARGGVPVAAAVATALQAPLDVLVVRKLGVPGHRELAMGALAEVGTAVEIVRNEAVLSRAAISAAAFEEVYRRELGELRTSEAVYRQGRDAVRLGGKVVICVDDGLATGSTMRAAIAAIRRQQPAEVIAAAPVGAGETCTMLRESADQVVCAWTPDPFYAVGQAYANFTATSDDEVRGALAR